MNIFYIHCHDAGRFLEPWTPGVSSPNVAAFCQESTVFTNAHCAAPTCSPSRAALLTGQTPHAAGMLGLAHRGFKLAYPERHAASLLEKVGYETVLSGIQHEFSQDDKLPYEKVLPQRVGDPAGDAFAADQAVSFLKERKERNRPIFMSCGFFYPHRPHPEPDVGLINAPIPDGLPSRPGVTRDVAGQLTATRIMDEAFGALWTCLQEEKWLEDSLVFLTTDHGIPFPDHKCTLRGNGTGVALAVRPPGPARPRKCDALVSHLDVLPGLFDYAGIPVPPWFEGGSVMDLIEEKSHAIRDCVFGEINHHVDYRPARSVRTRDHLLIRHFDEGSSVSLPNIDHSPSKDWYIEEKLPGIESVTEELYDLVKDPHETLNLAEDQHHARIKESLFAALADWMMRTQDPLFK